MECENCGLASDDSFGVRFGYCPFCDAKYPPVTSVSVNRMSPPDEARELRDLYTDVVTMLTDTQLGDRFPEFKEIEQRLYRECQEMAEYFDDIAGGD